MVRLTWAAAAAATAVVVSLVAGSTPAPSKSDQVDCSTSSACYPWLSTGPACYYQAPMNLRFSIVTAPENKYLGYLSDVTYAFCPYVDQLQAFNLSQAITLSAIVSANGTYSFSEATATTQSFVSAIGFANATTRWIPQEASTGAAMIVDGVSTVCDAQSVGIVDFLVLNVTMQNGLFVYQAGHDLGAGIGFNPTCTNGLCQLNADMKCIGVPGFQNCGTCVSKSDAASLANTSVQVWASYYGTDANGRTLTSGSGNPLTFRQFAGANVYSAMKGAYDSFTNPNAITGSGSYYV